MCLVLRYHTFFFQVYLVTEDDYGRVRILHLVDTLYPVCNRFVRFFIGHVETENYSVCLTVKLVGYVPKLFLTCSVPNLDLALSIVLFVKVIG